MFCRAPVVSRDAKSNKRFFTFHRPVLGQEGWEGRGGGGGVMTSPRNLATSPRNRATSPRNRAGGTTKTSPRNRGSRQQMAPHSRTMDPKKVGRPYIHSFPRIPYLSTSPSGSNLGLEANDDYLGQVAASQSFEGRGDREGRRRQEDFLPR